MDEHQGWAFTSLHVVEPGAIDVNEAATDAVRALGRLRARLDERRRAERRGHQPSQVHARVAASAVRGMLPANHELLRGAGCGLRLHAY